MAVDKDDPYFASLLAAYIISHLGGISRKHLTGDNNVITSIARYYVYYHMKRFTENPQKMSWYITNIRVPTFTIGIHTTRTNTTFGIISTECGLIIPACSGSSTKKFRRSSTIPIRIGCGSSKTIAMDLRKRDKFCFNRL